MKNTFIILVGKPEGKPLGRTERRWEDYINLNVREIGLECVNWIHLALDSDR
jgi:hypothetical protein